MYYIIVLLYVLYYRGWEQLEVTCNPHLTDKRSLWNIEEVIDSRCVYIYYILRMTQSWISWYSLIIADWLYINMLPDSIVLDQLISLQCLIFITIKLIYHINKINISHDVLHWLCVIMSFISVVQFSVSNSSFEVYAPGFMEKLIESHAVMTQVERYSTSLNILYMYYILHTKYWRITTTLLCIIK